MCATTELERVVAGLARVASIAIRQPTDLGLVAAVGPDHRAVAVLDRTWAEGLARKAVELRAAGRVHMGAVEVVVANGKFYRRLLQVICQSARPPHRGGRVVFRHPFRLE